MSRTSGGDGLNPPSSCGGEVVTLLSSSPSHSNTLSSYSYSHRYSHHALSVCDDVTYFAFPACTCVAVESWGHFPHSKRRLVSLLTRLQPRGLAFLSGDVHHGEVSHPLLAQAQAVAEGRREQGSAAPPLATAAPAVESPERGLPMSPPGSPLGLGWVEVTSSGLTHTCADSLLTRWLCPQMLAAFSRHRLQPGSALSSAPSSTALLDKKQGGASRDRGGDRGDGVGSKEEDGYFIGRNIGSMETFPGDASNNYTSSLVISVHNLTQLEEVLGDKGNAEGVKESEMVDEAFTSSIVLRQRVYSLPMPSSTVFADTPLTSSAEDYSYPDFPCLWDHLPSDGWGVVLAVCHPKTLIAIGVLFCLYFQFKCFLLIRQQIQVYGENFKRR